MRILTFLVLGIFTFQIFDIPPARNMRNPHTCCGRAICMCHHAKGAFCPFRHGLSDDFQEGKGKDMKPALPSAHMHCHLNRTDKVPDNLKIRNTFPATGFAFTKAPCASDTPKTVLPEYSRDFLLPSSNHHFILILQGVIPISSFDLAPLLTSKGIDRPPRIF